MLLAIDIGNTNIVVGIYEKSILKKHWRLSSSITRTSDETWFILNMLLKESGLNLSKIKGAIISSVVPNLTPVLSNGLEKHTNIKPIIVDAELDVGLKILYDDPKAVGADRIVNSIAALNLFDGPIIAVDFGTATTFDVISVNSEYLGGIIVPGIMMSANVLHHYAARLPKVELKFPDKLIGKTTESSIQSGLMFGTVELIDGIIKRIQDELGSTAQTIATGGLASTIIPHTKTISRIEPFLTLDGLMLIYQKINQ